ncbi:bifunctional helix-turn-helix transcriptional regulator/GNAT family N-acetyltransferase [Rhodocytophaga aerolata]|uniref:Bifunctional helix-turn-helix transcriptional regulator/GNAT family N-acetyltransferase n=1 Tax=Rhodocytophaga aerolata TaxID=455078 RepID=A0ABT8RG92_9BACT|nr:bifunctional helix-turn-helix transcriptional regulator/GNAT family N-acetyltransferase [Rhodocytophaga aerolata]MDO1450163.1 bifunctional helix-turn-helix transcriptional regulator/GNAT family N-acetyltransferase [Rhodocytophaga aerolata]
MSNILIDFVNQLVITGMQQTQFIESVREFNRFYTLQLGLLNQSILNSEYSLAQVRILYELAHTTASTSTHLCNSLHMDAGYVSRNLKILEKAQLLTKQKSVEDARSACIHLTDLGKKVFEQLTAKSNGQIDALTSNLSFPQKQKLLEGMQTINSLLADATTTRRQLTIRTQLQSADLGYLIYLHGLLYQKEYKYGIDFEAYVIESVYEFYKQYDPATNRIWLAEDEGKTVASLALMNRGKAAQLRYFLMLPEYRGQGLGKRMMDLFMEFLHQCNYQSCYLLTTHEQQAAANLYRSYGFELTEEKESTAFGKPVREQRYELFLLKS